jgi:glutathione synthase/RimK-type ligase-like ATP-grasp enzyme
MCIKIILTDLHSRKSFDLYNILCKRGYQVDIFSSSGAFQNILFRIAYGQKVNGWHKDGIKGSFQTVLENKRYKYVYFPVEESTISFIYDFIAANDASNLYYLLPPKESFYMVQDKGKFSEYCSSNNFPIPKEFQFESLVEAGDLPCRLIIKPRVGSGSFGILYIDSFREFIQLTNINFDEFIIQERLENSKDIYGAFFLFNSGKFVSYYGHKRIRTYPPEGGVTVFSKSDLNDELILIGSKLLESLNWSGLAMIEFLYDRKTDSFKIIEVNPRVWGSFMLSEFCESNMIENYIRLSLGCNLIDSTAKQGKFIRWLFPWDVLLFLKRKGKISNFWEFNLKNTCYINFSYAPWYKGLLFLIFNIISFNNIKKFFKKTFRK